ncbi:MAG: hypothetical protein MJ126_09885 [Lachnospiraceae bacterium]|nr:hypothetical protein [Lachnospiraceae bacterium]
MLRWLAKRFIGKVIGFIVLLGLLGIFLFKFTPLPDMIKLYRSAKQLETHVGDVIDSKQIVIDKEKKVVYAFKSAADDTWDWINVTVGEVEEEF